MNWPNNDWHWNIHCTFHSANRAGSGKGGGVVLAWSVVFISLWRLVPSLPVSLLVILKWTRPINVRGRGRIGPKAMMSSPFVSTDFQVCFDKHAKLKGMFCQVPLMLQHSNFNCAKTEIYRKYIWIENRLLIIWVCILWDWLCVPLSQLQKGGSYPWWAKVTKLVRMTFTTFQNVNMFCCCKLMHMGL